MDQIFRNRKYSLAVLFSLTSVVGLFTGALSGGEFLGAAGLILGLYGGANVMERKVMK